MRQILTALMLFLVSQVFSQSGELFYLWPEKVPGEVKEKHKPVIDTVRKDGVLRYAEITDPVIEVWLTKVGKGKRPAVIICPGGAYSYLAYRKEGTEIAEWINNCGYNAFILQYRVPDKRTGALQDAQRALRIIRGKADEWNTDAGKVGIMGFSAGGSLSVRTSTLFKQRTYEPVDRNDSLSCRPDFTLPIYPAYLDLGENRALTPELRIGSDAPPMFIFQSADDQYGNSSIVLAGALRDAKVPVEFHLVATGGHGYGKRPGNAAAETWPLLAEKWLKNLIVTKKNP